MTRRRKYCGQPFVRFRRGTCAGLASFIGCARLYILCMCIPPWKNSSLSCSSTRSASFGARSLAACSGCLTQKRLNGCLVSHLRVLATPALIEPHTTCAMVDLAFVRNSLAPCNFDSTPATQTHSFKPFAQTEGTFPTLDPHPGLYRCPFRSILTPHGGVLIRNPIGGRVASPTAEPGFSLSAQHF